MRGGGTGRFGRDAVDGTTLCRCSVRGNTAWMAEENAVLRIAAELGVPFNVVECDPALADTAEFCAAYGYEMTDSANAIVVVGKSDPRRYVCCVVLATTRLDVNGSVRRLLGTKKASFAPAAETAELTGMAIGGVTPFGLPAEVPVWIDARVMTRTMIVLGGGTRDCKIVAAPQILTAISGAIVLEDLALELPATSG